VSQDSEVVTLVLGVITLAVLIAMRRAGILGYGRLIAGFGAMLCAYLFTVLEGFLWHDGFDLLEHASYAASAWIFARAAQVALWPSDPPSAGTRPT